MDDETTRHGPATGALGDPPGERARLSRRQALGRMSAVATAGAVAWVAPEILTASPAGGASLSGLPNIGGSGGGGVTPGTGDPGPTTSPATTGASPASPPVVAAGTGGGAGGGGGGGIHGGSGSGALANTGVDIARDAEIGVAMIAGGWVLQRWASRQPKATLADTMGSGEAGSPTGPV